MEYSKQTQVMVQNGIPGGLSKYLADNQIEHLGNLYAITQRLGFKQGILVKLQKKGLLNLVNPRFVFTFKYHAFIGSYPHNDSPVSRHLVGCGGAFGAVQFIGDIPDSVLQKIEMVRECGIEDITIHSMQPLPAAYQRTDPVVLGWCENPHIRVWNKYLEIGTLTYPIFIANWDDDRELEGL